VLGALDFQVIVRALPLLLQGMLLTLELTAIAIAGGMVFGTLLALLRLSRRAGLAYLAGAYVNFFRSMPLILVIFWFYFLVPMATGQALDVCFVNALPVPWERRRPACFRSGLEARAPRRPYTGTGLVKWTSRRFRIGAAGLHHVRGRLLL
jgi:His/Glu/Gln/Arg/opine family amino acid ABC transporter permease subunit